MLWRRVSCFNANVLLSAKTVAAPMDHPCSYVLFGPPCDDLADEAHARGWRVAHLPGARLHQIIDPVGTARHLVELATAT